MAHEDELIERLSAEQCWEFLRTQEVGRVATNVGDVLDIFPINYYSDGSSILFRTAPGDKLAELTINENIVFEADGYSAPEVWSVVAKGTARVLETEAELSEAEASPLDSWVPTPKTAYVRLTPRIITGRRFERASGDQTL